MAIGEAPESLDELLDSSKGVTSMTADTYVTFFKSYAPEFDPDLLTMTTTEWVDIINRLIKNGMEELDSYYIMRLAKDKLKGAALEFVEKNHYSNYDQMVKSLLSEYSDHWFKSEVLKIVESGEALDEYPINQRRDRLNHLFRLMGSDKEAVYAIADYLYHEDNTAWEKVGIKPSQARAEDFAGYLDTYCDAADHIVARQTANKGATVKDLEKELKTLKANYQIVSNQYNYHSTRHTSLLNDHETLKRNHQTLSDSYNALNTTLDDLLSRFEKLDIAYKRRMGNY